MDQDTSTTRPNRNSKWLLATLLILTLLIVFGGFQLFYKQCLFWTCAPSRSFSAFDLKLPYNLFPDGATVDDLHSPSKFDWSLESGVMSIHWREGKGGAVYHIWRYGTEWQASRSFAFHRRMDEEDEKYSSCPGLDYYSKFADQYYLGCGESRFGGYRGDLIGRYEEFVISFNTTIDDQMSIEMFKRVLGFIDEQMEYYLK